jgi:hypothetical protein
MVLRSDVRAPPAHEDVRNFMSAPGIENVKILKTRRLGMRRLISTLVGVMAIGLTTAGIAHAAAAPAVRTRAATAITQTTAVLHGVVNPHGVDTEFSFNYGTTAGYGSVSTAISAGAGTRRVPVQEQVIGLVPGTTYHFQITATNGVSTTPGNDVTFTTKGAPPSTAVTGPASGVGKTVATVGGAIAPNGADTTWTVQYGTTTSYGATTTAQIVPNQPGGVGVAVALSGLAPATLFHYRLVATHPGGYVSYGADATFFTRPDNPPSADMKTKVTPQTDKTTPFKYTTSGTLNGGKYIPSADRCSGTVGIRYFNGKHQLGYTVADVTPSCGFSGSVSFKKLDGTGPVKLRVSVFYRGNGYLAKASKIDHPVAGEKHTAKHKK